MKITVFGAGAVGGHVAARLGAGAEAAGIEVSAVGRGAQLDAIRERGLTLWIGDERYDARIRATDRPEAARGAGCRLCRAEILDPAAGGPGDRAVARPGHQRRLRDERHPVVVSLSLPRERSAAPGSVASRPRWRIGAHHRAGARDRLHDRLGQYGRRARSDPQFGGHPQPFHARRAGRQRIPPGPGDLGSVRARRSQRSGQHRDPQRDLGKTAAQPQHQPDLRDDRRADQRDFTASRTVRTVQGADGGGSTRRPARTASTPASRSRRPTRRRRPCRTNPRCCRISKPPARPRSTAS